jgi:hypothetical protein
MLAVDAPFPHAGCTAYLRGSGESRRIIQRNADGSCTVEVQRPRFMTTEQQLAWANRGATRTQREDGGDLFATREEAVAASRRRPRRPSTPRRRGKRRG